MKIFIIIFVITSNLVLILSKHVLREVANHHERGDYRRIGRAENQPFQVLVAIKQNNLDRIESLLYDVSTPTSPNYQKFLSWEEIGELVRNDQATESVLTWLRENDVTILDKTIHGEYITAEASVRVWEELLETQMHEYVKVTEASDLTAEASQSSSKVIRAESFSLPEEVNEHIFSIHGITNLPARVMHQGRVQSISEEEAKRILHHDEHEHPHERLTATTYITPTNIRSIYKVSGYGDNYGSQAIYGAIGQTYLPSDLALFQSTYGLPNHPVDRNVGSVPSNSVCNNPSSDDCLEASLDIQYMLAVAAQVPITYWYDSVNKGDFLYFITSITNSATPSMVYSISYGIYELDISSSSITSFNVEAQKAGLRGITILASSGDDGMAGSDFRPRSAGGGGTSLALCGYYASWPASSPYVTAVGATMNGPSLTNSPEIVCAANTGSIITSGGGFSNTIASPSFQANAVKSYFAKYTPKQSTYQPYVKTNRAYPDLAMPGNNFVVIVGGKFVVLSGTSASCPVLAGMVALVNAQRLKMNLAVTGLGWLNPSIYHSNGSFVLNDITSGNNRCTASAKACCSMGFNATAGWDPVTGFGSVDFSKFLSYYTTNQPTFAPTASPTFGKTAYTVALSVMQILSSSQTSATSFASDSNAIDIFESIIASLLKKNKADRIYVTSIVKRGESSSLREASEWMSLASISGIAVNYTMAFDVLIYPSQAVSIGNAIRANVSSDLNSAVSKGILTSLLQSSSSNTLTSLQATVTPSINPATESLTPQSSSSGNSSGSGLDGGIIALIVIVVFVTFLVIALILRYFYCRKASLSYRAASSINNEPIPAVAVYNTNNRRYSEVVVDGELVIIPDEIPAQQPGRSNSQRPIIHNRMPVAYAQSSNHRPSLLSQSSGSQHNPVTRHLGLRNQEYL
jgi:subtilase family serine protease